jgi:hypothetical protein
MKKYFSFFAVLSVAVVMIMTACQKSEAVLPKQGVTQKRAVISAAPVSAAAISASDARAELRGYIENNINAVDKRFVLRDNLGNRMDVLSLIETDGKFVGVYHVDNDGSFSVYLATSTDLMNWTDARMMSAPGEASQADLYQSGNSFILAWEKEEAPRQIVLRWFNTIQDLYNNEDDGSRAVLSAPIGEWCGTPNIYSGNRSSVDIGFHYWDGSKDRNARGTTNWDSWDSYSGSPINDALQYWGCYGNIGGRDIISNFSGHDFTAVEGQLTFGDFGTWNLYLFDNATNNADPIRIKTPGSPNGVEGIGNPRVRRVNINGRDAIVVTAFIFGELAAEGESGPCIYYNYID